MKLKNTLLATIICFVMSMVLSGCQKEEIKSFELQNDLEQVTPDGLRSSGGFSVVFRGEAQIYTHTDPEGHTVYEVYCCPPYYQRICCTITADQVSIYTRGATNANVTIYDDSSDDNFIANTEISVTNCVVDTVNHYVRFVLE